VNRSYRSPAQTGTRTGATSPPSSQPARGRAAKKEKKQRGYLLLFLLIWAGLLYLGWLWVPEAVKDARLPYVPAVSEEELSEEQRSEYERIDALFATGELERFEDGEGPAYSSHENYSWLYGDVETETGEGD